MPLNPATLQLNLQAFLAAPPATEALCAAEWGNILAQYASTVVPASTTSTAAGNALKGGLTGMAAPGASAALFTAAFAAFGTSLAASMIPPGVPPASPFVLPVALTSDAAVSSAAIAAAIQAWMITGTAAPPASTPWA